MKKRLVKKNIKIKIPASDGNTIEAFPPDLDLCDDCGLETGRHIVEIDVGTIIVCDECYFFYQPGEMMN